MVPPSLGNPRHLLRRMSVWSQRRLHPGARTLVGLVVTCLGFLGFLPVLGFWMIPVGLVIMATDLPPLRRWLRVRLRPGRAHRERLRRRQKSGD